MKNIAIFGSTGSIGKSTIEIIKNYPEKFKVKALIAQNNIKTLANQANLLKPEYVLIENENKYQELKELIEYKCNILAGRSEIEKIASEKFDLVICAIMGFAGLVPTLNTIKAGNDIALANKEAMVCAGNLIIDLAKKNNAKILPIDSEHNAVFQVFENDNFDEINNIILTASGGPFFNSNKNFDNITIEEALNHPKWKMGKKISIDSATMMNKGLEMIEAYYLFAIGKNQIDIVIHPQSIIHGIVNYSDGSSLAMMGSPDMKTPISYILDYPNRIKSKVKNIDLSKIGKFEFFEPDYEKFLALKLCKEVLQKEGNSCIILNAANEVAVSRFLNGEIKFSRIATLVDEVLQKIEFKGINSLEEIIITDQATREITKNLN